MLKRWRIKNFKSFKDLPPVELSMVNVLAGANSSGKSTFIQSILLLKQTLQYGASDRPVALNGPLLRLGSFGDLCNSNTVNEDLEISFDIKTDDDDHLYFNTPNWAKRTSYYLNTGGIKQWKQLSLLLNYGMPKQTNLNEIYNQDSALSPALIKSSIDIVGTKENDSIRHYFRLIKNQSGRWPYHIETDPASDAEMINNRPEGRITGGLVSHFIPSFAVVRYNQTELDVNTLVDSMFSGRRGTILGSPQSKNEPLSAEVVEIINSWLVEHQAAPLPKRTEPILSSEAQTRITQITSPRITGLLDRIEQKGAAANDIEHLKNNVRSTILSERTTEYKETGGRAAWFDYASSYLEEFFRFGVRYLGPLRDSPRPVYQPEALESTTDVGYRGEHTAAVFEINKRSVVQYRRPPTPETEDNFPAGALDGASTLNIATAEWLEYLGVASSVHTLDAGVFGNRMSVSIEKNAPHHDLTNVGVGVSQVLPIVVMALLAPRGSLLIFEQPELHLHPKVQARLADFFLALALDGKQTILETHSEYLIDRLRLRIAMSSTDNVRSLVNIMFSEKRDGRSSLTPIQISEFGSITNWPADFFEQSQKDIGRIVQAASKKRKSKKQ